MLITPILNVYCEIVFSLSTGNKNLNLDEVSDLRPSNSSSNARELINKAVFFFFFFMHK